jgi:hypothetical protein
VASMEMQGVRLPDVESKGDGVIRCQDASEPPTWCFLGLTRKLNLAELLSVDGHPP